MASKVKRYIYADKTLPHTAFLKKKEGNQQTKHMGLNGVQILLKKDDKMLKVPLLGQIDTRHFKGVTVLDNNMYQAPIFCHSSQKSDFLCVFHTDRRSKRQIFIREINDLYTVGQQEPKLEVYNPSSRTYQQFLKRRTLAYVIRFLQENENYLSFPEVNSYFPMLNDQVLKKITKEINLEVDRSQNCFLTEPYSEEQFKNLITPENICQYESALFGEHQLKQIGILSLTNADKISFATNKFCSEVRERRM